MQHSGLSLFSALVGAMVAYAVGYGHAVLKRASKDYKSTKALVPGIRKTMWTSLGNLIKASALGAILFLLLAAWVVRDVRDGSAPTSLVPTSSAPAAGR